MISCALAASRSVILPNQFALGYTHTYVRCELAAEGIMTDPSAYLEGSVVATE